MASRLDEQVAAWCRVNGWTDLQPVDNHYWAIPPGAVMPLPIPQEVVRAILEHYPCPRWIDCTDSDPWLAVSFEEQFHEVEIRYTLTRPRRPRGVRQWLADLLMRLVRWIGGVR